MCLHYFKYSGARVERAGRSTRMMLTRCSIPTQSKVTKVFLLSQLLLTPDWVDSPHSTPSSHAAVKRTFTSQNDLLELVSLILKGQRLNVLAAVCWARWFAV